MVNDPVCGVTVDENTAKFKSLYALNVYYFHSEACKIKFDKDPQKYMHESEVQHHASHYGGYCPTPGCNKPTKGPAWYFYIGLLFLVVLLILLFAL